MLILFPESVEPRVVDPAFAAEREAARAAGFDTGLVSSTVGIGKLVPGPALYRGWMLSPGEYAKLHADLVERGVVLLTDPTAYRTTHYLSEVYPYLRPKTPESLFFPADALADRPDIEQRLRETFANSSMIIKDYVKSEKGYWHEACFIPDASDFAHVWKVVDRFLELRGPYLEGGLVFRRFLPLTPIPDLDPPASATEIRIFWLKGRALFSHPGGPPARYLEKCFIDLARTIPSPFFSMDVALVRDPPGRDYWTVIECGDGQVSSFPADHEQAFYAELREQLLQ